MNSEVKTRKRKSALSAEDRRRAKKVHKAILEQFQTVNREWTELARLCLEFNQKKYFRTITDPATGEPFRNFGKWARHTFGKAVSTVFASMRLVRELAGTEAEGRLESISKQNAQLLTKVKAAGKEITSELAQQAEELPENQFREEVKALVPEEDVGSRRVVITYRLSPEDAALVRRAEQLAAQLNPGEGDTDLSEREPPIVAICRDYLVFHEADPEALPPQKAPMGVGATETKEAATS